MARPPSRPIWFGGTVASATVRASKEPPRRRRDADVRIERVTALVEQAFEAGKAFGEFQNLLVDLPGDRLHETIPYFHNTRRRFEAFQTALKEDRVNRAGIAKAEIAWALEHGFFLSPDAPDAVQPGCRRNLRVAPGIGQWSPIAPAQQISGLDHPRPHRG